MAVELLTVSAYARHRDCDEKAVRKALAENRISAAKVDEKRRVWIDPVVADIQWEANTRPKASKATDQSRGRSAAGGAGGSSAVQGSQGSALPSWSDARARREHAEAVKAEVEAAKAAESVCDKDGAVRGTFTAFRGVRDAVMPIGRRLAPRLAAMDDVRAIAALLDEAHRKALQSFADKAIADLLAELGQPGAKVPAVAVDPLPADEFAVPGAAPADDSGGDVDPVDEVE